MYILSRTEGFVDAGEELAEDVGVRQIAKMVRCWWMARWSIDINVIGYRTDIITVRAIGALVRRYCSRQLAQTAFNDMQCGPNSEGTQPRVLR